MSHSCGWKAPARTVNSGFWGGGSFFCSCLSRQLIPMPPKPLQLKSSAFGDEIEAINSIYGDETLSVTSSDENSSHAILKFPGQRFSFTLTFPADYPNNPPLISGTQSTHTRSKGEGTAAAQILRGVITRVWTAGQVCLFDVIEEGGGLLPYHGETETPDRGDDEERSEDPVNETEEPDNNNNNVM